MICWHLAPFHRADAPHTDWMMGAMQPAGDIKHVMFYVHAPTFDARGLALFGSEPGNCRAQSCRFKPVSQLSTPNMAPLQYTPSTELTNSLEKWPEWNM